MLGVSHAGRKATTTEVIPVNGVTYLIKKYPW